ncbi:hypothetical protein EVAR_56254_1 [Eumeta japonica]|uniref:Uncharacterized protein n=1 Tax=Eumeta variegata TaxID=151549 RepID=A0A4C1XFU1_EUMVA|nr:hypothetical protein EVAR_56254_1 [Eumeta japonica]
MDDDIKLLKKLELDDQKKAIQDSGKNVTEQVTQNINKILEEKFFALEEKHEKLKETVDNQDKRIYFLEKQARQKNIVFFGIEELESSYETLEKNMLEWIEQHFSNLSHSQHRHRRPEPDGQRSRGRPPTRWEDDLRQIASPNWTDIARDRDVWASLEEAFTNQGFC